MVGTIVMTLKEIRLSKNLTQCEAAKLAGISLRSYKSYENDPSKVDTIKYKFLVDTLNKYGFIDESHGVLTIAKIQEIVEDTFSHYKVEYCYLFGSYAKGKAKEDSDVDLLVATDITGMDFFGLAEDLRENLHKKVDLLNLDQLGKNRELLNDILKDGIRIYGNNQR